VYLDYRKALDCVSHRRLIEKLKGFGINGKLLQWLESFLTSRTMSVMLSGTFSQLLEVLTGVPQGSVLGPLLFLLFVNELPSWIISDMKMFADDAKVWCRIKTETDRITLQELDLDHLQLWSNIWRLRFNADKCKVMHIGYSCGTRHYVDGRGAYKEGTGISTRGEGPGCNHHNRSEVIQSVHQINGNSKDGDRNGQKKFQTSGYR